MQRQRANIRQNARRGLHVRTTPTGFMFLYLNEQKICRYIPERRVLEFKEYNKGRVIEATVSEFIAGLGRIAE